LTQGISVSASAAFALRNELADFRNAIREVAHETITGSVRMRTAAQVSVDNRKNRAKKIMRDMLGRTWKSQYLRQLQPARTAGSPASYWPANCIIPYMALVRRTKVPVLSPLGCAIG
jgi:hypothetical protein